MDQIVGCLILLMVVGIPITALISSYFMPTIVAAVRKKSDFLTISLLNVFLGWIPPIWIYTCVCAFLDNPGAEDKVGKVPDSLDFRREPSS